MELKINFGSQITSLSLVYVEEDFDVSNDSAAWVGSNSSNGSGVTAALDKKAPSLDDKKVKFSFGGQLGYLKFNLSPKKSLPAFLSRA